MSCRGDGASSRPFLRKPTAIHRARSESGHDLKAAMSNPRAEHLTGQTIDGR